MPDDIFELASQSAIRARIRSGLRRQSYELPNSAIYAGYNADLGSHLIVRNGETRTADSQTSGGLAPSSLIEQIGGYIDDTPRPRQATATTRRRQTGKTFIAASMAVTYEYENRLPLPDLDIGGATAYTKYKSWIVFQEAGKNLINLYFPWKGQPIVDASEVPLVFNGRVAFDSGNPIQCVVTYLSSSRRLVQLILGTLTIVDTSPRAGGVGYPVRIKSQPLDSQNAEGILLEGYQYGYQADTFTFILNGSEIERMEVTRQAQLKVGKALEYSDWWVDYAAYLSKGEAFYNFSGSTFPIYHQKNILPGGKKTIHRGRLFEIKQPGENDLPIVKRLLLPQYYRVGNSRQTNMFIDVDQLNLPEDKNLRNTYVASAPGLPTYRSWLENQDNYSGVASAALSFYQRPISTGPTSGFHFWAVYLSSVRFTAFSG